MSHLREIIRGPFELEGCSWRTAITKSLADRLATEIEARGEPAVNLSEVQVACLQLWQSPNPEELYQKRKVGGLLEDFLSTSLSRMGDLADPAVALLARMVTASGTRNVISAEDAVAVVNREEGIPNDRLRIALSKLVDETKLVTRELRHDTYFYEIISEFLVPWILRQKVTRQERAARKKLVRRVIYATLSLIVLTVAGGYSWTRWINYRVSREKVVQDLKADQAALRLKLDALQRNLEGLQRNLDDAKQDNARLAEDLAGAQTLAKDTQKNLDKANADLHTSIEGTRSKDDEISQLKGRNKALGEQLRAVENQRDQYAQQLAQTQFPAPAPSSGGSAAPPAELPPAPLFVRVSNDSAVRAGDTGLIVLLQHTHLLDAKVYVLSGEPDAAEKIEPYSHNKTLGDSYVARFRSLRSCDGRQAKVGDYTVWCFRVDKDEVAGSRNHQHLGVVAVNGRRYDLSAVAFDDNEHFVEIAVRAAN
jgi:hypothetical protein